MKSVDIGLIADLKIEDLINFLELAQLSSVRELARRRNVDPATISRSLARLESILNKKCIQRSASGVRLTAEGNEIYKIISKCLGSLGKLIPDENEAIQPINFGSNSFISMRVLAPVMGNIFNRVGSARIMDFPPDELISAGLKGIFNIAIHFGNLKWPPTWLSQKIGSVKWQLYARSKHPIFDNASISLEQVLDWPFVYPIYWGQTELVAGDDQFPIPMFQRKKGVAASTAESAAVVVRNSDHLAFLPNLIIDDDVKMGFIRKIELPIAKVQKDIFFTVKTDEVKVRHAKAIVELIQPLIN